MYDYFNDSHLIHSSLKAQLRSKYRLQHFLAFTNASKEALYTLITFLFLALTVAYFGAHFLLWLTGYYDHSTATLIINHPH